MIVRWLILCLAVWAATLVPGIWYDRWQSLLLAALVLSILNAFVKPLFMLLSAPIIVVTLGFFILFINAFLLMFTAWFVPDFHVAGFWPALGGSLIISVISLFFGSPRRIDENRVTYTYHCEERGSPPPGNGPIIDV